MKWLSDETIEKRMRRKLAKYGYTLHKSRKKGGGYTVTDTSGNEENVYYPDLNKLIDSVEAMEYRFSE